MFYFTGSAYKATNAIKELDYKEATIHLEKANEGLQQKLLLWLLPSTLSDINSRYNGTIKELSYDEYKNIDAQGYSGSSRWDVTKSRTEKFKTLAALFD